MASPLTGTPLSMICTVAVGRMGSMAQPVMVTARPEPLSDSSVPVGWCIFSPRDAHPRRHCYLGPERPGVRRATTTPNVEVLDEQQIADRQQWAARALTYCRPE